MRLFGFIAMFTFVFGLSACNRANNEAESPAPEKVAADKAIDDAFAASIPGIELKHLEALAQDIADKDKSGNRLKAALSRRLDKQSPYHFVLLMLTACTLDDGDFLLSGAELELGRANAKVFGNTLAEFEAQSLKNWPDEPTRLLEFARVLCGPKGHSRSRPARERIAQVMAQTLARLEKHDPEFRALLKSLEGIRGGEVFLWLFRNFPCEIPYRLEPLKGGDATRSAAIADEAKRLMIGNYCTLPNADRYMPLIDRWLLLDHSADQPLKAIVEYSCVETGEMRKWFGRATETPVVELTMLLRFELNGKPLGPTFTGRGKTPEKLTVDEYKESIAEVALNWTVMDACKMIKEELIASK